MCLKIILQFLLLHLQANEGLLSECDNLKRQHQLLLEEQQLNQSQVCIILLVTTATITATTTYNRLGWILIVF